MMTPMDKKITERHHFIIKEVHKKECKDLLLFAIKFLKDIRDVAQECFNALMRKPNTKRAYFLYYQCTVNKETHTPDIHAALDREESKFTIEWFFSFFTPYRKKVTELVYL
ncbi:hypothetical protein GFS24_17735 [Chitinophaga sp. SYP-B3965]|uniref:hypothetical protein n=1 Tax=Chitinophaga sp. SYP-B3965 TaxID=2663120 RepID=UPI0012996AA5|nr:hypothetical protein [Chitinophaga sp. SYP-B3965]MRG46968.1 hypothetical protein [Chitinophaga sp. SYP-B3965]